jgi:phenylalanyl-tRNA synthetase beta chain
MKFTLSWLKDHFDTKASVEDIAETLTRIGLEVEEVKDPAKTLEPFRVAEVTHCDKHPGADKLSICEVDTGAERLQVICGAPNVHAGLKGVFAPVGSYVPGIDLTLTKAKIRGVESSGMLLSERELQLSDEHTGIIELDPKTKVGTPAAKALGLDDTVIEIAITPNRPDCLGVRGIARDLAAAGLGKLKPEKLKSVSGGFANPVLIKLEFDQSAANACPLFAGRLVEGVKNGPSPAWLQRRLKAIGLRPINALVDINNYISYDRGRPLHVYDADKLDGAIRARLGRKGESFLALDGKTYEVDADMCVIADEKKVLGLAGVIGGEDTGCTEATTNVFIESAYFDPARTARTGRKLAIQSDARYRFERGVDPDFVVPGLELATRMVLDICGGKPSKVTIAGKPPKPNPPFKFDAREIARLSGLDMPPAKAKRLLSGLGIGLAGTPPRFKATPPSWRPDISQPADLVEEVVRLTGVDAVPTTPMSRQAGVAKPVLTENQIRQRRARRALAARGLVEAVTWSFISQAHAEAFGGGQAELALDNPMSSEQTQMRPSLLPSLILAAQRNRDRAHPDGALFELGQAYRGDRPEDQFIAASGVRFGASALAGTGRHWDGNAPDAGLFAVKADAVAALSAHGIDQSKLQVAREAPPWYHPGRSGALKLGPKTVLAHFGELHPETLARLGADAPLAAFELFLDALPGQKRKSITRPALGASALQPVHRDFAFLVDDEVPAIKLLTAARTADRDLIADVIVFDVFSGAGIPQGKKSLAIEVTLQPRDKTLTDAEIESVMGKIVSAVQTATGGELRG